MRILTHERHRDAQGAEGSEARWQPADSFVTFLWFGLLTGWLDLGLILSWRALDPRVSTDMLRTNRHFVWMVPVSNVLIFILLGFLLAPLTRFCPKLGRWLALRLPVCLLCSALLFNIEGLYALASVILACGLASVIGPILERQRSGRFVRASLAAMGVGLLVVSAVTYERITSAERRAHSGNPSPASGTPNVLLIVLDDVRAASLSLYGHHLPTTPNLDRWARRGIVFSQAFATAPWTLPTHASLFTGRWPHELSVGPDRPLDSTFPTLAETLAHEGYATAGFVANTSYCNALYGLDRGFARYEDAYENQTVSLFETTRSSRLGRRLLQAFGHPIRGPIEVLSVRKTAEMLNRDVLDWVAARPAGQPFFAFLNYYDAHSPFVPPNGPQPRFGLGALPLAERIAIDQKYLDWKTGKLPASDGEAERIERDAINLYRDSYESCIAYLDHQLGILLDELDRRGTLANTLVIVTSDHGEHFSEHGLLGHGRSLYRREVHVPLVIIPTSRNSIARTVDEPISLRELPATVATCVGLGSRSPFPGRSLTRFLEQESTAVGEPSPVLCEVQHIESFAPSPGVPSSLGPVTSLVRWDRVYIRAHGGREELYDLIGDPIDAHNLANGPDKVVLDQFRETMDRICRLAPTPAAKTPAKTGSGTRVALLARPNRQGRR